MSFKYVDRFNLSFEVDLVSMTVIFVKEGKQGRAYDAGQYFQYFLDYGVRKADVVQLQEHFSIDYFQNLLVTGKESEQFEFCVKFVGEDYKILQCKMRPIENPNNSIIKISLEDISHKRVQQLTFIKRHFAQKENQSDAKLFDLAFEEADDNSPIREKYYKIFMTVVAILCIVLSYIFFQDVYKNNLNKTAQETLSSCQTAQQYIEQKINFTYSNLAGFKSTLSYNKYSWQEEKLFASIEREKSNYLYEALVFIDEDKNFKYVGKSISNEEVEYLTSLIRIDREKRALLVTDILDGDIYLNCVTPFKGVRIDNKDYTTLLTIYTLNNFCSSMFNSANTNAQEIIIINKEGDILWENQVDENAVYSHKNIFSYLNKKNIKINDKKWEQALISKLKSNGSGVLDYLENGQQRFIAYSPLEIEDTYVASISKPAYFGIDAIRALLLVIAMWLMLMLVPIILLTIHTKTERKERQQLEELAYSDTVTGGKNMNAFKLKAKPLIREMEWHYALVATNLQDFSIYNEKYGNVRGDTIIRKIFLGISKYIDEEEVLCRAYAEHMMILLKYEGESQLEERLIAMGKGILDTNFNMEFGVCIIRDLTMDLDVAIERANIALSNKSNKRIGNVIISYYDVKLLEQILFEKDLENTMFNAFRKEELEIFVEPRYDISTRSLCNGDAYAIWNHPEKGMLLPKQYEGVFERRGLIMWLDSFIFEQVCIVIKEHLDNGSSCLPITIQLHRNHFNIHDFLNKFIKIKEKYNIPGECLAFEISEETMFEKINQIEDVIEAIHKMKATCTLGEYKGTFLPIEVLSKLNIDAIKFSPGLISGELSEQIVEALVHIGKAMNLRVIATGVVIQAQILKLNSYGCNEAKGDVFAKNISLEEYIKII